MSEVHLLFAAFISFFQPTQYSMDHFSGMHNWYACSHARPTYCNVCREALSGVTSHGLSCEGVDDVLSAGKDSLTLGVQMYSPHIVRSEAIAVTPHLFIVPTEESLTSSFFYSNGSKKEGRQ